MGINSKKEFKNEIKIDNEYVKAVITGKNEDIFKIAIAITKAIEEIKLEEVKNNNKKRK